MGWAVIRGWALVNFFYLQGGHLFKVGTYSRLGAKSNKYSSYHKLRVVTGVFRPNISNNFFVGLQGDGGDDEKGVIVLRQYEDLEWLYHCLIAHNNVDGVVVS